ncbi:MFS transporter [Actinomadura nitritigenes]|uniref:MFS transporter n=1 Tax=Actinomadura nitritigenes TaxID=134602 RepID=UPI00367D68AA
MTSRTLLRSPARRDAESDGARRWLALVVVLTGVFMPILDFFIVNVAIPSIGTDLHATSGQTELIVAGYAVPYAALLIIGGRLGDRLGRRRAFALGMAGFTAASLLCGIAPTANALVLARAAQGAAAALLFPQVLTLIQHMFGERDRPRAMTFYGLALGLAAAFGQLLGGGLISADFAGLGWRWCFLINIFVGVIALAAVRPLVPFAAPIGSRLDVTGGALSFTGFVLLILPLTEGRVQGWPAWSYASLVAAALVLGAFGRHQHRTARKGGDPLVPPSLFADRAFRAGLLTVFAFYTGMSSFFFVLALQLQAVQGLSPVQSGLQVTPLALGFFATSLLARPLLARFGDRSLIAGAVLLLAAYAGEYALVSDRVALSVLLTANGLGQGMVMAPLIGRVLAGVASHHAGAASGVLATCQQLAGALGIAIIGIVYFDSADHGFQAGLIYLSITVLATISGLVRIGRSRLEE